MKSGLIGHAILTNLAYEEREVGHLQKAYQMMMKPLFQEYSHGQKQYLLKVPNAFSAKRKKPINYTHVNLRILGLK